MTLEQDARLIREREFHNQRFDDGDDRQAQMKYYFAVEAGGQAYKTAVNEAARGADVLEYGCGDADNYLRLAPLVKSLDAIDISDRAIERLTTANTNPHVRFHVMDAMNMSFADQSFDMVFGSGIVHHLDTRRSAQDVARVLRSGGQAIFWEPLGLNPLINLYRWLTPSARTPDEHPLLPVDLRILRESFSAVEFEFYGLCTLAAVPLRRTALGKPLLRLCTGIDRLILRVPGLRWLAWYALIRCRK
jgi:SAM-dependent methyltransferase